MSANGIPGVDPMGQGPENIRLYIGMAVYIIAFCGLIGYLLWKLPRGGGTKGQDEEGDET
ncbi:MAG: hypothetical protein ACOCQ9_01800 [Candidatus Brocadiia bacterium]